MYTFDVKDLVLSVKNRVITDFAEGGTVTVASVQPKLQPHYGLRGKVGVARNGVNAKQVTFPIMTNSDDCAYLIGIAERGEIFSAAYVDMNVNGQDYSDSKCFIEEVPEVAVGGEIGSVDVTITFPLEG